MRLGTLLMAPWRLRDLGRVRRIAGVLIRHGFEDVVARLGWVGRLRSLWLFLRRRRRSPDSVLPVEKRIRLALEELGPTFIKLGQMMGTRPDLVPMSLVLELRRLHDAVPPFPVDEVKAVIESDLGKPVSELFETFDETPVAAASIAQVHRARLSTGEDVVVKVQRPQLPEVVGADLRILSGLASMLEDRVPEIRQFRPLAIVEEFKRSLNRETDFNVERLSMVRYKNNFADEPGLYVPEPFDSLSTRRVLVMERVIGVKVTDVSRLMEMDADLRSIVETGMRVTMRSIFEFGFFHADPHPGNFFIRDDGTIALIDFGMMGSIEPQRIDELATFMVAMVTGDLDMMVNLLVDADLVGDDTDLRAMRGELRGLLDRYGTADIGSIDVSGFLTEVMDVTVRHHVVLPADLLLVGKSIATMEGIGREVYPGFEPLKEIRPYLTEMYVKRMLDAKRHSQTLIRSVMDGVALLKEAPLDIRRILKKARRGEFILKVDPVDTAARQRAMNARTNRILMAVLFPTFFFGGVYLSVAGTTLQFLASLVSFGLAGMFFFGLMVSMFQGNEPR